MDSMSEHTMAAMRIKVEEEGAPVTMDDCADPEADVEPAEPAEPVEAPDVVAVGGAVVVLPRQL